MKTIINFKGMDFLVTYEENAPDGETGYLGGKEITDIDAMGFETFVTINFYAFFHEADLFDELQEQLNNPETNKGYREAFNAMFDDTLERLEHITNPFKS
jgi:hypothetical protein